MITKNFFEGLCKTYDGSSTTTTNPIENILKNTDNKIDYFKHLFLSQKTLLDDTSHKLINETPVLNNNIWIVNNITKKTVISGNSINFTGIFKPTGINNLLVKSIGLGWDNIILYKETDNFTIASDGTIIATFSMYIDKPVLRNIIARIFNEDLSTQVSTTTGTETIVNASKLKVINSTFSGYFGIQLNCSNEIGITWRSASSFDKTGFYNDFRISDGSTNDEYTTTSTGCVIKKKFLFNIPTTIDEVILLAADQNNSYAEVLSLKINPVTVAEYTTIEASVNLDFLTQTQKLTLNVGGDIVEKSDNVY